MIASYISASGSSRPNPSIMTIVLSVEATIRSRSLSFISPAVGRATYLSLTRPSLTAPMGPMNGTCERIKEAEAPMIERTSASFSRSAEIGPAWIWTSSRNPSGKRGRIGRSMRREERISLVVGRPSRLMKPPGNLPAEYTFSR